jgi:hypothetical protein
MSETVLAADTERWQQVRLDVSPRASASTCCEKRGWLELGSGFALALGAPVLKL